MFGKRSLGRFFHFVREDGILRASARATIFAIENFVSAKAKVTAFTSSIMLPNGKRLLLNENDEGLSRDLIEGNGIREPFAPTYLLKKFGKKKGRKFVDVGANMGYYAVLLSDLFEEVLAIEPLPENLRYLKQNLIRNRSDNVDVLEGAISPKGKNLRIQVGAKKNWAHISDEGEKVRGIRLEDVLDSQVDLLKMDIGGSRGRSC